MESPPSLQQDREYSLTQLATRLADALEGEDTELIMNAFNTLEGELIQIANQENYHRLPGEDEGVIFYEQAAERLNRPVLVSMNQETGRIELTSEREH